MLFEQRFYMLQNFLRDFTLTAVKLKVLSLTMLLYLREELLAETEIMVSSLTTKNNNNHHNCERDIV